MVLRLFFCLAAVLTALFVWADASLLLWCIPLVVLLWVLITASAIFILFIISLFCNVKKPFEKDNAFCRFLAYHTMDGILAFFRFRIRAKGMEKVPNEPCVIVCNHLSRFDPMVNFVLMKGRKLGFISKKENMRIPIAGPIIQKIGFLPLDRENPLAAMRTIRFASKLVAEQGFTVGIYPEGTRSRNGALLEFKTGAFVLAKKADAPLVVARIKGTNCYKGRFPLRTTEVSFEVLEVLSRETVKEKKPEELSDICRSMIEKEN